MIPFTLRAERRRSWTGISIPGPLCLPRRRNGKKRCDEILNIQTMGLKKRLKHTTCQNAVVGISGGLDSTLALLVTARAFDSLGKDRSQITGGDHALLWYHGPDIPERSAN